MEYEEFQKAIIQKGYFCEFHTKKDEQGNETITALVCAEIYVPPEEGERTGYLTGISFQTKKDDDGWSIGLWSARTWLLPAGKDSLNLALDLLSGHYIPPGKTPAFIPDELLKKYDLIEIYD